MDPPQHRASQTEAVLQRLGQKIEIKTVKRIIVSIASRGFVRGGREGLMGEISPTLTVLVSRYYTASLNNRTGLDSTRREGLSAAAELLVFINL